VKFGFQKEGEVRLPEIRKIVLVALAVAATSGCAVGTPFHGEVSAAPSPVLVLSWAGVRRTQDGIVVRGQIKQISCCTRTISGHIHLEAKD
jgi:hypothetical protein